MPKKDISAALKKRAAQSTPIGAEDVNEIYSSIFGAAAKPVTVTTKVIPIKKLRHFFTTKIGFRPYSPAELEELANDIKENGLLERGIARPIANSDEYEVLSGNSRMDACKLLGWPEMPFEVETADDNRAIIIATVTNLKRRQNLLPSERGWAYRAMLEAQKSQGKRTDLILDDTCGESHHKLKARDKVAKHFGIDVNILRREIRLTYLIQPLLTAVDEKRMKATCGEIIAGYDEPSQNIFYKLWLKKGQHITPGITKHIKRKCPYPSFTAEMLESAWTTYEQPIKNSSMRSFSFSYEVGLIDPILAELSDEQELQTLFLEFLRERINVAENK